MSSRGPGWRWRLRRVRPLLRGPIVALRHRGIAADDVILAEYPKSGGTWLAFMVGEALFDRPIDFGNQRTLMPAIGEHRGCTGPLPSGGRILRTHERRRREYGKAVYLVRHVADVAVSYYHWLPWLPTGTVDFKDFLPTFLRGYADGYGSWASHVDGWLDSSGEVHVVRYEDMVADASMVLRRILEFLGTPVQEQRIQGIVANNQIDRMRAKERAAPSGTFQAANLNRPFVRQGKVAASNEWLDADALALIERHAGPQLRLLGYSVAP